MIFDTKLPIFKFGKPEPKTLGLKIWNSSGELIIDTENDVFNHHLIAQYSAKEMIELVGATVQMRQATKMVIYDKDGNERVTLNTENDK